MEEWKRFSACQCEDLFILRVAKAASWESKSPLDSPACSAPQGGVEVSRGHPGRGRKPALSLLRPDREIEGILYVRWRVVGYSEVIAAGRHLAQHQGLRSLGKRSSRLVFTGSANCDSLLIISFPLPRTENRYASPNERERGPSQGPPLLVLSADERLFCSPHPPTCSL